MKYKLSKVKWKVYRWNDRFKVGYRTSDFTNQADVRYAPRYFKTCKAAEKYANQLNECTLLSGANRFRGRTLSKSKFINYYGCDCCLDSRNFSLENNGNPSLCIHRECPYAKEIESYGGYDKFLENSEIGFSFAALFDNVDSINKII